MQDLPTGEKRQLTFQGNNSLPRWSHYSYKLGFLSDRNGGASIMAMPFAGGEAVEITRHEGPISEYAWSVDGRKIVYAALYDPENPDEAKPDPKAAPKPRVTKRRDFQQDMRGWLNDKRFQLWVVDVETKERRRITNEPCDVTDPAWAPGDTRVVAKLLSLAGIQNQLGLIDVERGEISRIGEPGGMAGTWCWSPDKADILVAGEERLTFQPELYLYNVASGQMRIVTENLPCYPEMGFPTFAPPPRPFWRAGAVALFHGYERARSGIYTVNTNTGDIEKLISWDAIHSGFHVDGEGTTAVQSASSFAMNGELAVIDLRGRTSRLATDLNGAQLAETPPARWERFELERAGHVVEAFLLFPHDAAPGTRLPLVIDIHGGPAGFYGPQLDLVQQSLAGAGYAVLLVNPRGSTTYGREFATANVADWAGEDYADLLAALDLAAARDDIDADRLGVYGYSYGGLMASWAIGHTDRFKAAVIGAPVIDLVSMYGTSDIGAGLLPHYLGANPVSDSARYRASSPLSFLHNTKTPSLILTGEADARCPIGQSEQLFTALLDAGVETEFARYPGEGHIFPWAGHPDHRVDFANRIIAWFDRFLKSR
jgi:dipeptidyl aminopeptidase/acylaminoacyl peptidase